MGDPRAPVIFVGVENDTENLLVRPNGEVRQEARVILKEEDVGRIRAGYVCAKCYEVQDAPFPKKCWLCGFPMADHQSEFVGKAFQGNVRVGPSSKLEDELGMMEELEKRRKRVFAPTQILLPGRDF